MKIVLLDDSTSKMVLEITLILAAGNGGHETLDRLFEGLRGIAHDILRREEQRAAQDR